MSIQLKNSKINPDYADLFSFESSEQKVKHNADMISFRVLSEVEKTCKEKNINKAELAKLIKTSKSYVTQLFRGDKHINANMMGKLEEVLNISFEIKVKLNEDSKEDFIEKQIPIDYFKSKRRLLTNSHVLYVFPGNKKTDETREFMRAISTNDSQKQKAG